MKISFSLVLFMLFLALLISSAYFLWGIYSTFTYDGSLLSAAWYVINNFITVPSFFWLLCKSLIYGFAPVFVALYIIADLSDIKSNQVNLRGATLVSASHLDRRTRIKDKAKSQIEIAGLAIPKECESSHFLLLGSTNSGKSVAVTELVSHAIRRDDRLIVIDPNGDIYSRFGKPGDVLLNPFDKRDQGWSIFNEIRKPYDYDAIAKSMVPNSPDSNTQEWHGYAQRLLSAVMKEQALRGDFDDQRLIYWCTQAPSEKLNEFLPGSAVAGMFGEDASRALGSTRFILTTYLNSLQYLRQSDFSLRKWLDDGRGNLYITWRQDMLVSLQPLISSWIDILVAHTLSLPHENPRRLWLFLDELASHGKLNSLVDGLTKGRKHGLRVVGCLQSSAQLDEAYGHFAATTLRSCFRNVLAMGCSNSDSQTADLISQGLGQAEIERDVISRNQGSDTSTLTVARQRETTQIVLPSQLMQLPPLEGFLALAGDHPIAKVRLTYHEHLIRNPAFEERM
jgi:type IV secretory pathway TraG/TraD family ATPase VirD4